MNSAVRNFALVLGYVAVLAYSACVCAECDNIATREVQEHNKIFSPEYSTQIQRARQVVLDMYEHRLLGNSDSAINQKVARPPGASVAVAVNGKVVWAEGIGFADLEQCVPVTPKTKFRIGSVSKPLTSAGAALLYEQGRLNLDAPIQKYVPSFPEKGYAITVRQLLGHLGGIRNYNTQESNTLDRDVYHSVTESLKRFKDDPLVDLPGTKFHYSTYGFVLASAAMETASGQDFLSFMHDKVFQPLGMESTMADESAAIIPNRARWYTVMADGSYRNTPYEDLSYKWAGGGFLSTPEDLARFGAALLKPGFLKQDTLTMLFSRQKTNSGDLTRYGLDWEIHDDKGSERRFEHSGGVAGSSSWLVIYPDQGVVIAWAQNSNDFRDAPLLDVASAFFSQKK